MAFPWGLLVLALLALDALSLWALFDLTRDAGNGYFTSVLATGLYVVIAFAIGVRVFASGAAGAMRKAAHAGIDPSRVGRAVLDGVLVVAAAVLLMVPGLVSDALAALLLFPPTRALFRPLVKRGAVVGAGAPGVVFSWGRRWGGGGGGAPPHMGRPHDAPPTRPREGAPGDAVDVEPEDYRVE